VPFEIPKKVNYVPPLVVMGRFSLSPQEWPCRIYATLLFDSVASNIEYVIYWLVS